MKMGNAFGKKTPKSEAAYSDAPKSFAGASEPNSFSRNESKAGRVPMSEADINEGPSETRRETSKAYKVSYTERRTRHSKKSDKFSESRSSEGSRASVGNLLDQQEEDVEPAPSEIGLNAYTEELGSRKGRGSHSDMEYGGRRSTHTMNSEQDDHMYVEQMSEIRLTESIGGTLGARVEYVQTENYIPEPYAFPSRSESSNIQYHDTRPARSPEEESPKWNDRKNIKQLGARPLGEIEPPTSTANTRDIKRTSSSEAGYNAKLRAGSYDVFAPSGPIGIVVDTTKEGPAVHSLKSTSPMLGLINPGDLIVALDDEDTREMTAATLTRLMAKRSRQNERKITLIAMDNY